MFRDRLVVDMNGGDFSRIPAQHDSYYVALTLLISRDSSIQT
jgi:hypothetical protein